ncbi:hypothetical protein JHK85_058111 [Glycine max]|nr:hypothetical protein JHK85_058111 [Glycine max]
MASKSFSSSRLSKQKTVLILSPFSIGLTLSLLSMKPKRVYNVTSTFEVDKRKPSWFDVIEKSIDNKRIKVGLVNVDTRVDGYFQVMKSYNGGDQALVNEVFTWWHRLPTKLNYLKSFEKREGNENLEVVPEDLYVMHYLVLKPWMCNSLIEIMTVIGT